MIPKIIHYCWFGEKPLPKTVKKCIESWKKYCPDYEIIQWNESNFDINCNSFVKIAYESKMWAFVSDYARLKVIYDNGGVYFDTDVELIKNIDVLLNNECYIGIQQEGRLCNTGLGFGAIKSSPVVLMMLKEYENLEFILDKKEDLACPYLNTKAILELGYSPSENIQKLPGITILPCKYLDPLAPGDGMNNLLCNDTISIHHYSATWLSRTAQIRRVIIRIIGQDKMMKLKRFLKYER